MRFLVNGCHFQGQKNLRKEMKKLEVMAILVALNPTTSCNIKSSQVFTKMEQKIRKVKMVQLSIAVKSLVLFCKIPLLLCYFLNLSLHMCKKREDLQKLRVLPSLLQGREQMHAILKPLGKSLNYFNFFRTLIMFFSVRNLIVTDKI